MKTKIVSILLAVCVLATMGALSFFVAQAETTVDNTPSTTVSVATADSATSDSTADNTANGSIPTNEGNGTVWIFAGIVVLAAAAGVAFFVISKKKK